MLVQDAESVIRQHLSFQLLPLSIVTMLESLDGYKIQDYIDEPSMGKKYNEEGYQVVLSTIVPHLQTLLHDLDVDVRRAAADAVAGLTLTLRFHFVFLCCILSTATTQAKSHIKPPNYRSFFFTYPIVYCRVVQAYSGGFCCRGFLNYKPCQKTECKRDFDFAVAAVALCPRFHFAFLCCLLSTATTQAKSNIMLPNYRFFSPTQLSTAELGPHTSHLRGRD